jgi:cap1 methyltransferase
MTIIPFFPSQLIILFKRCGAPGGFSEYIFSMCKDILNITAIGFGMSLVGTNQHGTGFDWNLRHPNFLIVNGSDGTGDIYKWGNIQWLRKIISQHNSCRTTVDLVVADGGLDVQRDSEIQETLTYELFVSQVAAALFLLKQGGNFVVKFFGSQNTETKVVIQHLYNVFEKIAVVKPIVSRPASSERYLICLNYGPPPQQEQPLWDAQIWRDQMIRLAYHYNSSNNEEVDHKSHSDPELEEYLDNNSREMFSLNMKACTDIVRMLETMTSDQAKGQTADEEAYHPTEHDIHSYQTLWKLSNAHKQPPTTINGASMN